jgi:hypothetical protein
MVAKSYTLTFDGYWLEAGIGRLPANSGIYGVYACVHNAAQQTVNLKRLLYIGEAGDVQGRVAGHERLSVWKRQLKQGEVLCFNAALISPETDRQQGEAAMIFKHKPPCNTEYVDSVPFDTTRVTTSGKNALMLSSFIVMCTEKAAALARRW